MIHMTFFRGKTAPTLTAIIIAFASFGALIPVSGTAQEDHKTTVEITPPQEVERWFSALGGLNQNDFDALIADDAKIVLKDLGIEQTKQKFISSLQEWNRATRGASITYRYQTIEDNRAVVMVCYRFISNEQLNLETFIYENKRITGSVQELKSEKCGNL